MSRPLSTFTSDEKDALRLVNAFASALAYATMFSAPARKLAAAYLMGPEFEGEPPEVIAAFVELLLREGE